MRRQQARNRHLRRVASTLLLCWALLLQSFAGHSTLYYAPGGAPLSLAYGAGEICAPGGLAKPGGAGEQAPAHHEGGCIFCGIACMGGGCCPLPAGQTPVGLAFEARIAGRDFPWFLRSASKSPSVHPSDIGSRAPPVLA